MNSRRKPKNRSSSKNDYSQHILSSDDESVDILVNKLGRYFAGWCWKARNVTNLLVTLGII